uniref:Uncharacterized protein n=1 Tax=Panagrolaimus davidi TaxID=227884 RepID=A0A914PF68_9BILA
MYSSFIVNIASIVGNSIIRAGIRYLVLADLAAKLEGVYFYPFHSWVIAFVLLWFTKHRKIVKITPYDENHSETGETYFEQLKKQWKN